MTTTDGRDPNDSAAVLAARFAEAIREDPEGMLREHTAREAHELLIGVSHALARAGDAVRGRLSAAA